MAGGRTASRNRASRMTARASASAAGSCNLREQFAIRNIRSGALSADNTISRPAGDQLRNPRRRHRRHRHPGHQRRCPPRVDVAATATRRARAVAQRELLGERARAPRAASTAGPRAAMGSSRRVRAASVEPIGFAAACATTSRAVAIASAMRRMSVIESARCGSLSAAVRNSDERSLSPIVGGGGMRSLREPAQRPVRERRDEPQVRSRNCSALAGLGRHFPSLLESRAIDRRECRDRDAPSCRRRPARRCPRRRRAAHRPTMRAPAPAARGWPPRRRFRQLYAHRASRRPASHALRVAAGASPRENRGCSRCLPNARRAAAPAVARPTPAPPPVPQTDRHPTLQRAARSPATTRARIHSTMPRRRIDHRANGTAASEPAVAQPRQRLTLRAEPH